MPGHKPSPVICIIDIHGIAVKALLLTLNTVRGRIDKTSYRTLPLILKRKTSFIFLPLAHAHDDMGLRKDDFRLGDMKISFCKTFDLIFQIGHLLIILFPARRQKNATMNYSIIEQYLAMGEYKNLFPYCIHVYRTVSSLILFIFANIYIDILYYIKYNMLIKYIYKIEIYEKGLIIWLFR